MYRLITKELIHWKDDPERKPLLLRGARQIGKSYTVERFGAEHFKSCLTVNFEFEPQYLNSFQTLDPVEIISNLAATADQAITPGETLLFLDEIQECPNALLALRYFKEKMPDLHVIAAGSLLELVLNTPDFRMPVGRIQYLYMKPCTFKEYLQAVTDGQLLEHMKSVTPDKPLSEALHQKLLKHVREYYILGGMPEVIASFANYKDYYRCQKIQTSILELYQNDFGKYARHVKPHYLKSLFLKIPGMVSQNFRYSNVEPDALSRDLKPALQGLIDAGLVYSVNHTSATGLPLNTTMNERIFKCLFLDVGLVSHRSQLDINTLLNEHLVLVNKGMIAEQFVGQELLGYSWPYESNYLYFWQREKRGSSSEVDYVIHVDSQIFPVEVKSGKTGRLKSLRVFINEKQAPFGIRISMNQFSFEDQILSIPLYMIHELPRLVRWAIQR